MLILSRKKEESIVIGDQIEIQVLKIKGNVVRLGIKAPAEVKVLRGELSPFDVSANLSNSTSASGRMATLDVNLSSLPMTQAS